MRRIQFLMVAFLSALALLAWFKQGASMQAATAAPAPIERPVERSVEPPVAARADALPREVAQTRALVEAGGPFPYERDGIVFGNFEGRLPDRPRGWYHEYTVPTPGVDPRGARRLVTGGTPPSEWWYTDDHYETFEKLDR